MYDNILAAVNEYSNSEAAARYAVMLAQACNARLILMFVASEDMAVGDIRKAEAALERLFLEARAKNVAVESLIRRGDPFRQIAGVVRDRQVALVFAATRREDIPRRYFLKTLARRLILQLKCSVALVRVVHPGRIHPRKILVPYRGRAAHPEEKAFFVGKLAEACGAAVTLFHAHEGARGLFKSGTPAARLVWEKAVPLGMERFMEELRKYSLSLEKRLEWGPSGRAITVEAAARRNDLIIMGASERGLWESLIVGNPVEEVLRETPCNLIILLPRLKRDKIA